MTHHARRVPIAVVATLTFGSACGEEAATPRTSTEGSPESGDAGSASSEPHAFVKAVCAKYSECDPAALTASFSDIDGCRDYYQEYYVDFWFEWGSRADNADACTTAVEEMFDCYADQFLMIGCEEFNEPGAKVRGYCSELPQICKGDGVYGAP